MVPIKKETRKARKTVRTLFNPLLLPRKAIQPKVESPLTAIHRLKQARRLHNLISYIFRLKRTSLFSSKRRISLSVRRGADKSLARPGRKQATATKLEIYSTCSPRSSIHFLARCSNFCKPLKKKFRTLSVQSRPRGSNDRVGRKMANFQLFFSLRGTVGSPMGPDPENRVGDQETESPGRPVSYGLQVSGEPGHCRARTRPP